MERLATSQARCRPTGPMRQDNLGVTTKIPRRGKETADRRGSHCVSTYASWRFAFFYQVAQRQSRPTVDGRSAG